MDPSVLAAYITFNVLLALMPGPDNLCVLAESSARGAKRGFYLALGFAGGVVVHTLLCVTGLTLIIAGSPKIFAGVKIAGALYLAWLCLGAILEKPQSKAEVNRLEASKKTFFNPARKNLKGLFIQGFCMNLLNPKVILFFVAFIPQFLTPVGWDETVQLAVLGALFMANTIIVFGMVAALGGVIKPYLEKSSFKRFEKWLRALLFGAIAAYILLS